MVRIVKPDMTQMAAVLEDSINFPVHVEDDDADTCAERPETGLESDENNVPSVPDTTNVISGSDIENDRDAGNVKVRVMTGVVVGDPVDDPQSAVSQVSKLCPICGKTFHALQIHMRRHRPPAYECSDCGQKFARSDYLSEHRHVHSGERPFLCAECGRSFGLRSNFRAHLQTHLRSHSDECRYQCDQCGKWFRRSSGRNEHIRNVHEGRRAYKCVHCLRTYSTSNGLKLHLMEHTKERPHRCQMCPKQFKSTSLLNRHLITHTGQRLYPCGICGHRFTQRSAARTHEATQHSADGGRHHECELCGQRFNKRSIRDAHVRRHKGEKPYACSMCHWTFAFAGDLRNHMIKKHKAKRRMVTFDNN